MYKIVLLCLINISSSIMASDEYICGQQLGILTRYNTIDKNAPEYKCLLKCIYIKNGLIDPQSGKCSMENFPEVKRLWVEFCENQIEEESATIDSCKKVEMIDRCVEKHYKSAFQNCASSLRLRINPDSLHDVLSLEVPEGYECFQVCIYRVYNVINFENEINLHELKKYVNKNLKVMKTISLCKKYASSYTGCGNIVHTIQCVKEILTENLPWYYNRCIDILNVEKDDNGFPFIYDKKMSCFWHCYYTQEKLIDAKGQIIITSFARSLIPSVFYCRSWITKYGYDQCTRINKFNECIYRQLEEFKLGCRKDTGLSYIPKDIIPSDYVDKKTACYYFCLHKVYGFVNENGYYDPQRIVIYFKDGINVTSALNECYKKVQVRDICYRSVEHLQCVKRNLLFKL